VFHLTSPLFGCPIKTFGLSKGNSRKKGRSRESNPRTLTAQFFQPFSAFPTSSYAPSIMSPSCQRPAYRSSSNRQAQRYRRPSSPGG
jgi:hypothetical protein